MFNWILDVLASRSTTGTKKRASYYGRRATLVRAHNELRHARNSIPAPKTYTLRTPRKAKVVALKVAA